MWQLTRTCPGPAALTRCLKESEQVVGTETTFLLAFLHQQECPWVFYLSDPLLSVELNLSHIKDELMNIRWEKISFCDRKNIFLKCQKRQ